MQVLTGANNMSKCVSTVSMINALDENPRSEYILSNALNFKSINHILNLCLHRLERFHLAAESCQMTKL